MFLSDSDWQALSLSLRLAALTSLILLVIGTPIAWWLARSKSRLATIFDALIALPLILPPTVIGFYLLLLLSPQSWLGQIFNSLGLASPAFSFSGLVFASVIYSAPFVIQPLQNAFSAIDENLLETARTMGAKPLDRFLSIILPICKKGFLSAFVLAFAHTIGEFGIILMIGGNIPGETQVLSIKIYEHVELLNYAQAHKISALLVSISFISLIALYSFNRQSRWRLS